MKKLAPVLALLIPGGIIVFAVWFFFFKKSPSAVKPAIGASGSGGSGGVGGVNTTNNTKSNGGRSVSGGGTSGGLNLSGGAGVSLSLSDLVKGFSAVGTAISDAVGYFNPNVKGTGFSSGDFRSFSAIDQTAPVGTGGAYINPQSGFSLQDYNSFSGIDQSQPVFDTTGNYGDVNYFDTGGSYNDFSAVPDNSFGSSPDLGFSYSPVGDFNAYDSQGDVTL